MTRHTCACALLVVIQHGQGSAVPFALAAFVQHGLIQLSGRLRDAINDMLQVGSDASATPFVANQSIHF